MRKILGYMGAIGAGKDYISHNLGGRLVSKGYKSVVPAKFASSLNGAVASILGVDERELQDRSLKEQKRFTFANSGRAWSSRDVQKEVGSVFRKNLGADVFINALANHYSDKYYDDAIILISDLRYQNEVDWVREQGGKVLYIHNEKAAQAQHERECNHPKFWTNISETKEDNWVCNERTDHVPPESEELQWDFYNKVETPDYWLDNNDFSDVKPFDDFVQFVVDYLEN